MRQRWQHCYPDACKKAFEGLHGSQHGERWKLKPAYVIHAPRMRGALGLLGHTNTGHHCFLGDTLADTRVLIGMSSRFFLLQVSNRPPHHPGRTIGQTLDVGLFTYLTRWKPCPSPPTAAGGRADPWVDSQPDLDDVPGMTAVAIAIG